MLIQLKREDSFIVDRRLPVGSPGFLQVEQRLTVHHVHGQEGIACEGKTS